MQGQEKTRPETKRTAPRDVRRKQLIMAAVDSISKRGFSDTTLKHVTQTAKLSHGVVNYHFDSKEALYDATLGLLAKEHYELWKRYVAEAGPEPANQLQAMIEADFDKKVCTPKRLAVWFAFWGQAKYRPNYLKIHSSYDEERHDVLIGLSTKLIEAEKRTDISPDRAARMVEALIDGYWLDLMLYPSSAKRDISRAECLQSLALIFPKHFTPGSFDHPELCKSSV